VLRLQSALTTMLATATPKMTLLEIPKTISLSVTQSDNTDHETAGEKPSFPMMRMPAPVPTAIE